MEAELLVEYDALFADAQLRKLMSLVNVDNATEELHDNTDNVQLNKYCLDGLTGGELIGTRLNMKKFINKYFFNPKTYDNILWYERLISFEKFMTVAMKLESYNLLLMNKSNPEFKQGIHDVPQAYAKFAACISRARSQWERIRDEYRGEHEIFCDMGKKFVDIYINSKM